MPDNFVEVHPYIRTTTINLNLHQYRFIDRLISVITNSNPSKINISGYLTVSV